MLKQSISPIFKSRRERLIETHPGSVFILPAAREVDRNPDVTYPFRQESNFYYLSAFDEPEAFLVIAPETKRPGRKSRTILFVRERNVEKEIWEGARYGVEGALSVFGVDEAYLTSEFNARITDILSPCDQVFFRMGHDSVMDAQMLAILEKVRKVAGRSGRALKPIQDPNGPIGEMRLFKDEFEIGLMRAAGLASAQAHIEIMKNVKPGTNEAEIEAFFEYDVRRRGCGRLGYGSIVAAGKNATCLHYRQNNEVMKDGDLVLIDAGGEYDYYSADITRTFPIGRSLNDNQRKAYELVLATQKAGVAMVKPGVKMVDIHKVTIELLVEGIRELGLMKLPAGEIIQKQLYKQFYPHNTSHWLGMDVHDSGLYHVNQEPRTLQAGMVLTIEPGFYVQPNDLSVSESWRGIGIRIEDDILVTPSGHENLTSAVPKELDQILALKSSAN